MIKVNNGVYTYEVTQGAYETIYRGLGFVPESEYVPALHVIAQPIAEHVIEEADNDSAAVEATASEASDAAGESGNEANEVSEDERWCTQIRSKPISQWSKQELKRYATIKGINLEGEKTESSVRSRIASSWS